MHGNEVYLGMVHGIRCARPEHICLVAESAVDNHLTFYDGADLVVSAVWSRGRITHARTRAKSISAVVGTLHLRVPCLAPCSLALPAHGSSHAAFAAPSRQRATAASTAATLIAVATVGARATARKGREFGARRRGRGGVAAAAFADACKFQLVSALVRGS